MRQKKIQIKTSIQLERMDVFRLVLSGFGLDLSSLLCCAHAASFFPFYFFHRFPETRTKWPLLIFNSFCFRCIILVSRIRIFFFLLSLACSGFELSNPHQKLSNCALISIRQYFFVFFSGSRFTLFGATWRWSLTIFEIQKWNMRPMLPQQH